MAALAAAGLNGSLLAVQEGPGYHRIMSEVPDSPRRPRRDGFEIVPAVHTAFDAHGGVALEVVEYQAAFLASHGLRTVFVAGTTGEGLSLREGERAELAAAWVEAGTGHGLRIWVHVGGNDLAAGAALAEQAQAAGAHGVAALPPHFIKPGSIDELVAACAEIAAGAPELPFFYYDIPALSGVHLSTPAWMEQALERIPNLGGVKYTNPDLAGLQECLRLSGDDCIVYYGNDESLLAGLALGAHGAVGSTYNFAAPLAQAVTRAFEAGELAEARDWQFRIVQLVRAIQRHGYLAINKSVLGMLGVDGLQAARVRRPLTSASDAAVAQLRTELESLGFFAWLDEARG